MKSDYVDFEEETTANDATRVGCWKFDWMNSSACVSNALQLISASFVFLLENKLFSHCKIGILEIFIKKYFCDIGIPIKNEVDICSIFYVDWQYQLNFPAIHHVIKFITSSVKNIRKLSESWVEIAKYMTSISLSLLFSYEKRVDVQSFMAEQHHSVVCRWRCDSNFHCFMFYF